ncbi:MAG: MerR family DNA-binding transcriptional regulator [Comamonadaceae bacterium]|nr:MAG: MerR family DNA-binding transcriptional regulator [Comamonadaceae bacterium]
MRISELAQSTGVSAHALRHYERIGLLAPARTAGGYRDYPASVRREVVFIRMSRRIGFSLHEIGERLPAYRSGRLTFDDMVLAMRERIAQIDAQLSVLKDQRAQAVEHIAWLRAQEKKHQALQAVRAAPQAAPWPSPSGSRRKNTSKDVP